MMSNPSQTPKTNNRFKELALKALRALAHNAGFKILALLLALLLWAGLITQDPSLTRERTFTGVNVSVTGNETLQRNGFIVTSDLDEVLGGVTLRVAVPQMQYQNAQASSYNTRIDLSRITEAGEQSLRILTVNSTSGTVLEVTPSEVAITVEEYITRYRIPVRVHATGFAPDGFYAGSPTADPPMIAVSGPRSLVEQIVCAEATIDLGNLPAREGTNRMAVGFSLLDESNQPIESDLLEITSESVLLDSAIIEQQLYSLKAIPLSDTGLIRGTPADGYEIKSVSITPEIITVAGSAEVLAELDALYPEDYLDMSGLTQSINRPLRLRDPGNLAYTSTNTITVAVEIGPVIQSRTFSNLRLEVVNVGENMIASLGTKYAAVTVSGPRLWLDKLRNADVSLYVDVSGLTQGEYHLPLLCTIAGAEEQTYNVEVAPDAIDVMIREK